MGQSDPEERRHIGSVWKWSSDCFLFLSESGMKQKDLET